MKLQLMRLRKDAGYKSRRDMAKALGISERKYKSWETEETRLTLDDACDIADFLHCTLDELAGRDFHPISYSDPRQRDMNAAWEQMTEEGKTDTAKLVVRLSNTAEYEPAQAGASKSGPGASVEDGVA